MIEINVLYTTPMQVEVEDHEAKRVAMFFIEQLHGRNPELDDAITKVVTALSKEENSIRIIK